MPSNTGRFPNALSVSRLFDTSGRYRGVQPHWAANAENARKALCSNGLRIVEHGLRALFE